MITKNRTAVSELSLYFLIPLVLGMLSVANSHAFAVAGREPNTISNTMGFTPYVNPTIGITLLAPTNWNKNESSNKTEITFFPPSEENKNAGLKIQSQDTRLILGDYIGSEINNLKNTLPHFKILNSGIVKNSRINFSITFDYIDPKSGTHYKQMNMYFKKGLRVYEFWYSEEIQRYPTFLPTALKIIGSLMIHGTNREGLKPGIGVGNIPYGLDVDTTTNLVYVADSGSNQISVINGTRDFVEANITVNHPYALAIDPDYDKLYVTNGPSNSLSVVDGRTNRLVDSIKVGKTPNAVAVDPGSQWVFTANRGDNTVSVIDGVANRQVRNITVGKSPSELAVNRVTKTLYVANSENNTVSVLDYFTSHGRSMFSVRMTTLRVGHFPDCVTVNQNTNLVYVCNGSDNTVTVINGSTQRAIRNITVGKEPVAASVNQINGNVYVANYKDDKIAIIADGLVKSVSVGIRPSGVVVNPVTNLVDVSNDLSNVVHVINGFTGNPTVGINFRISPPKSGNMLCNGERVFEDVFFRFDLGSALTCKAEDNSAFVFAYWSGSSSPAPTSNPRMVNLTASNYGDLIANFIQAPSQAIIPPELLYGVILGPVVGAIAGWFLGYRFPSRRKV